MKSVITILYKQLVKFQFWMGSAMYWKRTALKIILLGLNQLEKYEHRYFLYWFQYSQLVSFNTDYKLLFYIFIDVFLNKMIKLFSSFLKISMNDPTNSSDFFWLLFRYP